MVGPDEYYTMTESHDLSEDEEKVFTKIRRRAKRIQEGNAARKAGPRRRGSAYERGGDARRFA